MLFRYLAARLRYPHPAQKRYIRSGLALAHRARVLRAFWSDHQARSRAAQSHWAEEAGGDILTVLGAGPLLDFNAHVLSSRFKRFRLVDANPLAVSNWSGLNRPVDPVITDISGCIDRWADSINRSKKNWKDILAFIRELGANPVPAYSQKSDGVLSLNVLSQLDVGWQEAVEPILKRRFGRAFARQHEQEWLAAIQPGSRTLIEQHLAALEISGARSVLLITDVEYVEYTGRTYSRYQFEAPPMEWSESGWRADADIHYEVIQALEGVELDHDTLKRWIPSYELQWRDTWLWHIAPNGTEKAGYGRIHRVAALSLQRDPG